MTKTTINCNRNKANTLRAFSLAELMIAVGILGIGMLMIAMGFPVALDQSRQTVELTTSKTVLNEAVNTLKTRITWTQLEQYTSGYPYVTGDPGIGVRENIYRLGPNEFTVNDHPAYLLDFDTDNSESGVAVNFFPDMQNSACFYPADTTYGWMAAVQKISNQTYKFWIFILREPTGVLDNANDFKFIFRHINNRVSYCLTLDPLPANPPSRETDILVFKVNNVQNIPPSGTTFLASNSQLYTMREVGEPNGTDQKVKCDKRVSDGILDSLVANTMNDLNSLAYPEPRDNARVTRKNPVVAVYEVVIGY